MSKVINERIQQAFDELKDQERIIKQKKCDILIKMVTPFGDNEGVLQSLKSKGLPKAIIVSTGFDKEVVSQLSFFCPVQSTDYLTPPAIMFSWTEFPAYEQIKKMTNICLPFAE